MTQDAIPRSDAWNRAKKLLRPLLKMGGRRAYSHLSEKFFWLTVFVNYIAIRHHWLGRWLGRSAWPDALYIEGTNICNARCVFCAYPQMQRPKKVMPMGLFMRVIDQYASMGGSVVDLTPIVGDPFVDRFLFERLDYLNSDPRILRFHFYTNAILMKSDFWERLVRYGEKLSIYCSFGGFDRQTYHKVMGVDKFDEAVAGIRGLIEAKRSSGSRIGVQVNLRVPPRSERGEFWDYLSKCNREGLITIEGMTAYDSWAGMIKEESLKDAGLAARPMPGRRGPCHRLITSPVVLADGRVNACACRDVEASLIVGDTKNQTIPEILNSEALHDLIERHARGDFPEVCRRCTYYDSVLPHWIPPALYSKLSKWL